MNEFVIADVIHDLERTLDSLKDAWVIGDHVRYRACATMLTRLGVQLELELEQQ